MLSVFFWKFIIFCKEERHSLSVKFWKFPVLVLPANKQIKHQSHDHVFFPVWVTWPDISPLNRALRESPDWLLLIEGLSVLILGKAGSRSALWLDAAVSLTDQEIPEDIGSTGNRAVANCSTGRREDRQLTADGFAAPADLFHIIFIIVFLHQTPHSVDCLLWLLQLKHSTPERQTQDTTPGLYFWSQSVFKRTCNFSTDH